MPHPDWSDPFRNCLACDASLGNCITRAFYGGCCADCCHPELIEENDNG